MKITEAIIVITLMLGICAVGYEEGKKDAKPETINRTIEVPKELTGWEILTMAIIAMESEYDSTAISEMDAYGILQITPVYVDEVNRILGKEEYTHNDAFSAEKSLEMFSIYQEHYNPEHDIEKAIKLHNPTAGGWYVDRVLREYRRIVKYESIRNQL